MRMRISPAQLQAEAAEASTAAVAPLVLARNGEAIYEIHESLCALGAFSGQDRFLDIFTRVGQVGLFRCALSDSQPLIFQTTLVLCA
jgi:hypothetical protein